MLKTVRARILKTMRERVIDAQFQKSPLPVLRGMAAGAKMRILATDPLAVADFRDFCKVTGHALVAASESGGVFSFSLKVKATPP